MINVIQQRLERLLERQLFILERINVGRQIKLLAHQKQLVRWHCHFAFKLNFGIQRDIIVQMIGTRRDQNRAPIGGRICSIKCCTVIGNTVSQCTIIAHIHKRDKITHENGSDIFNFDVVDPHNAAIWPRQIQTKMTKQGIAAPYHVNAIALPRTDDRTDLNHVTVTC